MRALTLYRPWPWAIFHLGPKRAKRVENRTWPPPKSIIGERIALHAGARFDDSAVEFIARVGGKRPPEAPHHPVGIVGLARVVGYCEPAAARSIGRPAQRWYMGAFGWFLDDVVALDKPIECRGSRRVWTVPRDVEQHWTALEAFYRDLDTLGLRRRRQHDFRRTFISLARADGARKDILETITHVERGDIVDAYTTLPWEAVCAEVVKLKVKLVEGKVIAWPSATAKPAGAL